MHITAQGPRVRSDLYCVELDVKLYYTIPCLDVWSHKSKGYKNNFMYGIVNFRSS